MSKIEKIESDLRTLSVQELEQVRDWLEGFIEDQLQATDEFKASVERGRSEFVEAR